MTIDGFDRGLLFILFIQRLDIDRKAGLCRSVGAFAAAGPCFSLSVVHSLSVQRPRRDIVIYILQAIRSDVCTATGQHTGGVHSIHLTSLVLVRCTSHVQPSHPVCGLSN